LRVGILSYQGDVKEHLLAVERCGAQAWPVKYAEQLGACDALIIPGGESTTIGKLIVRFGLVEPLREFAAAGKPVFGTCAGLILLAKNLVGSDQFRLNLMDIVVERNAYGRQTESFEAPLESSVLGAPPLHPRAKDKIHRKSRRTACLLSGPGGILPSRKSVRRHLPSRTDRG